MYLSTSDSTKTLLTITTELILLTIITETITYINWVRKRKPSTDRIKTHLREIGDENVWSIENLPNLSQDIRNKGLVELVNDSYKIKQKNVNWLKRH